MEKIRNLSVRKTIILYMAVGLTVSFFLSAGIVKAASLIQERIWAKYLDSEEYSEAETEYFDAVEKVGTDYLDIFIPRPPAAVMGKGDHWISEACDFLQTYTVLVLSILTSCGAVFLFYRHKLKAPLRELEEASKRIAENDLDFRVIYESQDEMGHLCQEFERMRGQLQENNRALWKNLEEERALRAAIAHDIRAPLSVLKGYQEMLLTYLPDGAISTEKAVEMLSESTKQIGRMDAFVEAMRKMNSLESRQIQGQPIRLEELEVDIRAELDILAPSGEKEIVLQSNTAAQAFSGDREVILEVAENLLSNALRYAKRKVEIRLLGNAEELRICVKDDGSGFQEDAETVTQAFHQKNIRDSLSHAGLGMYISRLYCEKHGGKLLLENDREGGAVITAVFRSIILPTNQRGDWLGGDM